MAAKFALIVLAIAVAACNAEVPFRGYRAPQQQQAAPYPAAGFRPDRAFNLPSDEAIAQQLRLAQIIKLQQQLQREQQQLRPSQLYGAPSESEASQPQQPSGLYGAPQEEAPSQQEPQLTRPQLTRPQRPSQTYGAPQEAAASQRQPQVLRPQQPSRQYGAPQISAASQRQVQRQPLPSRQYGPPSEAPVTKAAPEGNSAESLEETKEVETVAAVANSIDNKPGRLTQGNDERDTENDETETTRTTATAPAGFVLVPLAAAGYTPQKLAYFQAPAVASAVAPAAFAKLQLSTVFGVQQPKLLAPQLLTPQGYYQPQQFAFAAPLQAW